MAFPTSANGSNQNTKSPGNPKPFCSNFRTYQGLSKEYELSHAMSLLFFSFLQFGGHGFPHNASSVTPSAYFLETLVVCKRESQNHPDSNATKQNISIFNTQKKHVEKIAEQNTTQCISSSTNLKRFPRPNRHPNPRDKQREQIWKKISPEALARDSMVLPPFVVPCIGTDRN